MGRAIWSASSDQRWERDIFNDIDYLRRVTERTVVTEAPGTLLQGLHPAGPVREPYLFHVRYEALVGHARAAGLPVWPAGGVARA